MTADANEERELASLQELLSGMEAIVVRDDCEQTHCDVCGARFFGACEPCGKRRSAAIAAEATIPKGPNDPWLPTIADPELLSQRRRGIVRHMPNGKPVDLSSHVVLARLAKAPRLVLEGPGGSGKTTLAVALLRAAIVENPFGVMFISSFDLAEARLQHKAGHGEAPLVQDAFRASLLLLDELGNEPQSKNSAVLPVITKRFEWGRPTWFTTPFDAEALTRARGENFSRRVFERSVWLRFGCEP